MKQKNNDMDFGTVPVIVPPELGRPGYQGEENPGYTISDPEEQEA